MRKSASLKKLPYINPAPLTAAELRELLKQSTDPLIRRWVQGTGDQLPTPAKRRVKHPRRRSHAVAASGA